MITDLQTEVRCEPFGKTADGEEVLVYTLSNQFISARILTYGATLHSLECEDRQGRRADIVLGYDTVQGYEQGTAFHGAIIGRYANRIANGRFTLDGRCYQLPKNDNGNTLHGGPGGFHSRVWRSKSLPHGAEFTYVSPAGEEGFPGTLTITVRYVLAAHDLRIEYSAQTDEPTVVNLTNHAYFNLAGEGSATIRDHHLQLAASHFTPINERLIPTGETSPIAGSPMDFREPHAIGERISADDPQMNFAGGYDFNWVLDQRDPNHPAALAQHPATGRTLEVFTDQPGLQFYSGNFLNGSPGKSAHRYERRSGFCLETQHFPDSPNHPHFPTTVLRPGDTYLSVTTYRLGIRSAEA
jgi:aldose 1-epimerase